jgi:hypothetical protein
MSPYFSIAILILAVGSAVFGLAAVASGKGFCSPIETHVVCFREWMKAFAPLATLVAACFAAFAVIAAWQNLTETQKGSAVHVDEILRHRLIAMEKETDEFNKIASKSLEITELYSILHDPSEDVRAGVVELIPNESI